MLGIAIDVLTADGRPEGSEVGGDLQDHLIPR